MKLSYNMVSETGLKRTNNEDAVLFYAPEKPWIEQSMGTLAVVSDGMGGYARGEKASAMVVELLKEAYFTGVGSPEDKLREAAVSVNNAIAEEGLASAQKMGATCTALVMLEDRCFLLHVGDSRCYFFQEGQLRQITSDHTAANELATSTALRNSEQTMLFNPHALTKAMGMGAITDCHGDVFGVPNDLEAGDRILLCSDGLYLHVKTDELQQILRKQLSLKETRDRLVKLVMQRGARDNFSFILIERED